MVSGECDQQPIEVRRVIRHDSLFGFAEDSDSSDGLIFWKNSILPIVPVSDTR